MCLNKVIPSKKLKMNGCFFQEILRQNVGWFLSQHRQTLIRRSFTLKPKLITQIPLKNSTTNFQISPPRSVYFHVIITEDFERFQYFNFETGFPKNGNFFKINWSTAFQLKVLRPKTQHFHTKLPCPKPMSRQIEWGARKGPIRKNGVLPLFYF